MNNTMSTKQQIPSKFVEVLGSKMHYLEAGEGNPILLLHSIPHSSHAWRNIIPYLTSLGRCIAPDLIGFGRSDKPDIQYTVADHIKYIEKFIEAMHLNRLTIIMHGWGSLLGFSYAMSHEKQCRGLVFYEPFLRPEDIEEISLPFQEQVNELQEEDYDLVTPGTEFIDRIIPQQLMRALSTEELQSYREPFAAKGSAKPIIQYIKELTGSGKNEIDNVIKSYSKKLISSKLPKLMLYTVPGFITTMGTVMWAKKNLPNLEVVDIGEELHLAQETYPELMGETISVWLQGLEATRG